jgi:hypothetical protein
VRVFPALLALVWSVAVAGEARAGRTAVRLTPATVASQPLSFIIKGERSADDKKGECLRFRIAVSKGSKGGVPPRRSARVEVHDAAAFVASCPVQEAVQDGSVSYAFEVAARYAAKSTFEFCDDRSGPSGEPAGIDYWFYLADFAAPAPPSPPAAAGRIDPDGGPYLAYWLTRDPPDAKSGESQPVLLLTRVPVANLADYAVFFGFAGEKKPDERPPLLEYIAITLETAGKDSVWNSDGRPLKPVRSVGPVRPAAGEVTLNEANYRYEDCPIRDVVRLLEQPEGKLPVHRLYPPLAGAGNTARALTLLLKEQLAAGEKDGPKKGPLRIGNGLGFRTLRDAKSFRDYWGSLPDENKLTGKLSDHLTRDRIESVVALEVNIAVAQFSDPMRTSLDEELQRFLSGDGRFHTGRLPDGGDGDRGTKTAVLLIRTKAGEYGLVTFYFGFVVVEMKRQVGVVLDDPGDNGKDKGKK